MWEDRSERNRIAARQASKVRLFSFIYDQKVRYDQKLNSLSRKWQKTLRRQDSSSWKNNQVTVIF